ncbi:type II toxin-antitoxin system PemI/MazE family antitoxin [Carnobacterium antarcticum]|uniref:Type II toxin-antitoxin system PemI/MazE family antitoxin n=2 Tax=Carnobacterium TaxID=2747 RepID=A0ABW4NKV6_9LACT
MVLKRKTFLVGDSLMINLPDELHVKENATYYFHKKENGAIVLIPEVDDYFKEVRDGEFSEALAWEDIYIPQVREWEE